jgi:hypothetical protein
MAEGISLTMYHEEKRGWVLYTHAARPGEFGPEVDRSRYEGLSSEELLDVVTATLVGQLALA